MNRGTAHQVVIDYWNAANAKDWDAFVGLVAEDVVYEAPRSRTGPTTSAASSGLG